MEHQLVHEVVERIEGRGVEVVVVLLHCRAGHVKITHEEPREGAVSGERVQLVEELVTQGGVAWVVLKSPTRSKRR
jgi:hypothetical protein